MHRTNCNLSLTVYSNTANTVVPKGFDKPQGTTHFVDLISFEKGDASIKDVICLAGTYIPSIGQFYFEDKSTTRLIDVLCANFQKDAVYDIYTLIKGMTALNIQMESLKV